jgi:hypothetical protein
MEPSGVGPPLECSVGVVDVKKEPNSTESKASENDTTKCSNVNMHPE